MSKGNSSLLIASRHACAMPKVPTDLTMHRDGPFLAYCRHIIVVAPMVFLHACDARHYLLKPSRVSTLIVLMHKIRMSHLMNQSVLNLVDWVAQATEQFIREGDFRRLKLLTVPRIFAIPRSCGEPAVPP